MQDLTDLRAAPATSAETVVADRRRPGRSHAVSPELIPLLRGQGSPLPEDDAVQFDEPDQMRAARGLVAGVALSAPLWLAIFYVGRWVLS